MNSHVIFWTLWALVALSIPLLLTPRVHHAWGHGVSLVGAVGLVAYTLLAGWSVLYTVLLGVFAVSDLFYLLGSFGLFGEKWQARV